MSFFWEMVDVMFRLFSSDINTSTLKVISFLCFVIFIALIVIVCRFLIMTPNQLKRIANALEQKNAIEQTKHNNGQTRKNEPLNSNDIIGPKNQVPANKPKSILNRDISELFTKK